MVMNLLQYFKIENTEALLNGSLYLCLYHQSHMQTHEGVIKICNQFSSIFLLFLRCLWKHCTVMKTVEESVCCCKIKATSDKCKQADGTVVSCITEHPGFSAVCLNVYVRQTAFHHQYSIIEKHKKQQLRSQ